MVLIDVLDARYADYLLDNIRKLGFDPQNIRYVVITQAYADHFSAAARLQDAGARVALGTRELGVPLAGLDSANLRGSVRPRREMALTDGQTLILGGNTFRGGGEQALPSIERVERIQDRTRSGSSRIDGWTRCSGMRGPGRSAEARTAAPARVECNVARTFRHSRRRCRKIWRRSEPKRPGGQRP